MICGSFSFISFTISGKSSLKVSFFKLNDRLWLAKERLVNSGVSMEPRVGVSSTMNLKRPVRMVVTDQAGFQESG